MVMHDIVGVFALIVTGAIITSALSQNAITAKVLSTGLNGFAGLISAMKGTGMGGNASTGASGG